MNSIYIKQILTWDPIFQPAYTEYQTPVLQVQIAWNHTSSNCLKAYV